MVKNWITDPVIKGSILATARQEGKMAEKKVLYNRSGVVAPVVKNWITDPVIKGSILATAWHEGKMEEKMFSYNRSGMVAQW